MANRSFFGIPPGPDSALVWTRPTFVNNWVDYEALAPGVSRNAMFAKDERTGVVYMRGLIKTGAIYTVAFTLPMGYRPPWQLHIVTTSNSLFGHLVIGADGTVNPSVGSSAWVSLAVCFATNQGY